MALAFNVPVRNLYFYPLATHAKFAERLRPENASQGVARRNKFGDVVYEKHYDAIGGRIVGFHVIPPSEKVPNAQYQVVVADVDDPSLQGNISFGRDTSLGRQLINLLLALTPEMLANPVTFTLRMGAVAGENGERKAEARESRGVYLNLFKGKSVRYEDRIRRRFERDKIPPAVKMPDGTWDYTEANEFFAHHAAELAAEWKVLLPQLQRGNSNPAGPAEGESEEMYGTDETFTGAGELGENGYTPPPIQTPADDIPF